MTKFWSALKKVSFSQIKTSLVHETKRLPMTQTAWNVFFGGGGWGVKWISLISIFPESHLNADLPIHDHTLCSYFLPSPHANQDIAIGRYRMVWDDQSDVNCFLNRVSPP